MDGNDGEGRMMRTSPVGKIKPLKSLVRTFRLFSFIVSAGYQHHRISDGLSNVRRKMSPKVQNAPMPEVWTHDNPSRHFMPRSNTMFQVFILLCSIVNYMFYAIDGAKLRIFLRTSKSLQRKADIKQTAEPIVQKCKCKRIFSLYFGPLLRKLIALTLIYNATLIIKNVSCDNGQTTQHGTLLYLHIPVQVHQSQSKVEIRDENRWLKPFPLCSERIDKEY